MGTYVTPSGFKRKTLQEVRQELETQFKQVFGPAFETAVDSPNGVLISQLALAQSNLWELALEVFVSRDPNQATGVALDWIAALNGISRKQATSCKVKATLYSSKENLEVPAGSRAIRERGSLPFTLDESVTIQRTACASLLIRDDGSQKSTEYVFHFTFGDVTLNNSSATTANLNALQAEIIDAGGLATFPDGTVAGGLLVRHGSGVVGITGALPDDFEILAMDSGNFTATEEGYQTCEIGELNQIGSAVEGWEEVYNFETGVPGSNFETDEQLRARRIAAVSAIQARGTDPALTAHLIQDVDGVITAATFSNRTMQTDADNRPPKSFECLVVGGTDADVARCIYENQPAGIQSYGNTAVQVVDDGGDEQTICFSRPEAKYLWIKITYSLYSEEQAPTNDEIKVALMAWADREYQMGTDVIPSRVLQGLYTGTTGVGQASVQVAITSAPDGTPSYGTSVISISAVEYAALANARISLVRLT